MEEEIEEIIEALGNIPNLKEALEEMIRRALRDHLRGICFKCKKLLRRTPVSRNITDQYEGAELCDCDLKTHGGG
jgi:hypothetical protein